MAKFYGEAKFLKWTFATECQTASHVSFKHALTLMERISKTFALSLLLLFGGAFLNAAFAQGTSIAPDSTKLVKGMVINGETGSPVPRAHITLVKRPGFGVVTNLEGHFRFNMPSDFDSLKITFIGYKPYFLDVGNLLNLEGITVPLEVDTVMLETVEVNPIIPVTLLKGAILAVEKNFDADPYKFTGFYRETIRENDDYLSMAEAVFEIVNWPDQTNGLSRQLKLIKGRKSDEVKASRVFEDFLPGGGPNMMASRDLLTSRPSFFDSAFFQFYDYELAEITSYEGRRVYIIAFDQKEGISYRLEKGLVFLDQNSLAVVRYESAFSPRGKQHIKNLKMKSGKGRTFSITELQIGINFQEVGKKWYISDAQLEMEFNWQQPEKSLNNQLTVNADFLVTNIQKEGITPLSSSERWGQNDVLMKETGAYDDAFWGDYNIIQPSQSIKDVAKMISELEEK